MLLVKNGCVIDPVSKKKGVFDILIDDGKIVKTGENLSAECTVIDATGLFVTLGFCDVHVHFRDPGFEYKEDIFTGARAAAAGGFTDVVLMANTKPATDNEDTLTYVLKKGKETQINVHACGCVSKNLEGKELTDMDGLKAAGAIGFTDDGIPLMDEALLKEAFLKAAALDVPISLHEEDKRLIKENGINHGAVSDYFGIYGSPSEAESSLVKRDIDLALSTDVRLNIQHISTKEGVELVREARKRSKNIFAEVTPHHLLLNEEAVKEKGTNAKMNPPLRTEEDRKALLEGVKDGSISIIATDHAPHSTEEKNKGLTAAPSGIIGLETAFSGAFEACVDSGMIPLEQLVEMLTVNPRRLYKLECEEIKEGANADLVIFSDKESWVYEHSFSKSVNSPFFGRTMTGKIKYTICRGELVYEDL